MCILFTFVNVFMSLRVAEALFPSVAGDLDALRDRYNPREVDHVVSRVAPSPTGMLHLGTLLSALVPWMFIHQSDGTFILRIEDTDQNRKIENGVQFIIDNLIKDFGLTPDEGRVAP
jgi:glutamyl-tRNA synthetase